MSVVTQRKGEIIRLLKMIDSYPFTDQFKHEMMTYGYVLVCGAIEFMTENILEDWVNKTIKHHEKSDKYKGKIYIKNFLVIQSKTKKEQITKFSSTSLDGIRALITEIAGVEAREKFTSLLRQARQSIVIQSDIDERLKRICRFRHELAHGQKMPQDTQPNIAELREDFLFVYEHIIKNIIGCLPRV